MPQPKGRIPAYLGRTDNKPPRYFKRTQYQLIAKAILGVVVSLPIDADGTQVNSVALSLVEIFKTEYPEFDKDRFLRLCGLLF